MEHDKALIGIAAAIAAGVIWGFLGLFVRTLSDSGLDSLQMTTLRYVFMTIVLFIIFIVTKHGFPRIDKKMLIAFIVMGAVGVGLNSVSYLHSMTLIPLSISTVLQYLSPFIVVAISVPLFKEKLTIEKALGVFIAFAGCILCTGALSDFEGLNLVGVFFGALSGFAYSFYTIGSRYASSNGYDTLTILMYTAIICLIVLIPVCDFGRAASIMASSWQIASVIVLFAIIGTLTPFALYNYSINIIGAGRAAIITFVEPMVATLVGFAFYGEVLTAESAVGILMILISLIIVNKSTIFQSRINID